MKFHLHLLIDAKVNNPPKDEEATKAWFDRLIKAIDMEKFGGPWAKYCDDPENRGLTGQAWLTTSHTAIHAWDACEQPFLKFDVYSCKEFEVETVVNFLREFDIVAGSYTLIDRTHPSDRPKIEQGFLTKNGLI